MTKQHFPRVNKPLQRSTKWPTQSHGDGRVNAHRMLGLEPSYTVLRVFAWNVSCQVRPYNKRVKERDIGHHDVVVERPCPLRVHVPSEGFKVFPVANHYLHEKGIGHKPEIGAASLLSHVTVESSVRQVMASLGACNQPLQDRVEIRLFLCADAITANLSMRD